jgi:hypothetical protein
MLRHVPQGAKQRHDIPLDLIGQAINHPFSVPLRADQTGPSQLL